jgi:hypothetical protein
MKTLRKLPRSFNLDAFSSRSNAMFPAVHVNDEPQKRAGGGIRRWALTSESA